MKKSELKKSRLYFDCLEIFNDVIMIECAIRDLDRTE